MTVREVTPSAEELRRLTSAAAAVDGVDPFSGHVLQAAFAGHGVSRGWADEDGLVAAVLGGDADPLELAVDPRARGRGLGGRILRQLLAGDFGDRRVWAHGDLPAARALAASHELRPLRQLLQLRRSGAWPPVEGFTAELPEGVTIRQFRPGSDEDAFLAVNARAFSWHPEQGRLDRAGLAADMAEDWFDPAGFLLAVDADGTVLGFHWTKVHPHDEHAGAPVGEIYVLGVDPLSPIRGLGAPLTDAGLRHLSDQGLRTVLLYVEGDNARALALYRRAGFTDHRADVVYGATDDGE